MTERGLQSPLSFLYALNFDESTNEHDIDPICLNTQLLSLPFQC